MDIQEIEQWFETHVAPDVKRLIAFAEAHAANAQDIAALVESLIKTFDPSEYPEVAALVAEGERVAAEAVKIYDEITSHM